MNAFVDLADAEEIGRYELTLREHLDGVVDAERFMAVRLQHGIYGQRQDDVYMVRVKLPGGVLTPERLDAIGELQQRYADNPFASITTRQDIQLHFVKIEDTPAIMRSLASVGLTTREACGNTVRNMTACPLAGSCPREHTDVRPMLNAAAAHFLRHPLTQHLPRKFKMSFSGCEADCAQGMIHDLAVVAVRDGDSFGFKVLAAGGLGHKPRPALVLESFLPPHLLLPCIEAVVSLHHRHSDRTKRARSRIKFLVERFGADGFLERYREEFARTQAAAHEIAFPEPEWRNASTYGPVGSGAPRRPVAQRQQGLYAVPVALPLGDINAEQLRGIAAIMKREGLSDARATQDQNLVLLDVPEERIPAVTEQLGELGVSTPKAGDDVVSCPGTWTCRLGITTSRDLAGLVNTGDLDLRVRVSSCHNGCGQPYVGDIGLHGEGRRLHGRLVPHYRLHLGGDGCANGSLAVKGPEIPSARVPKALQRVTEAYKEEAAEGESFGVWAQRQGEEYFRNLLNDLSQTAQWELDAVRRDHGQQADFRVLALGGGECAGVAEESVSALFAEASYERGYLDTFFRQRKYDQALECASTVLHRVGQGVLSAAKQGTPESLDGIIASLRSSLPTPELAESVARLEARLETLKHRFDTETFESLIKEVDSWSDEAQTIARRLEAGLPLAGTA